jgi:hypothetical protein
MRLSPDAVNRTLPMSIRREVDHAEHAPGHAVRPAWRQPGVAVAGAGRAVGGHPGSGPAALVSDLYTARSLLNPEQLDEARQELDRVLERWADIHEGLLLDVEVHGK